MSAVALALLAVGGIVVLVAGVMLLVKAFQTSVLWGLGYMFVPFVSLIFVVLYWQETKKPFLYLLGGAAILLVGVVLGGPSPMAAAN
jgi:hypothetical protein